jgi:hypothetical protein
MLTGLDIWWQSILIEAAGEVTQALALFSHILDNYSRPSGMNTAHFLFILADLGPIPPLSRYINPFTPIHDSSREFS